MKCKICGNEKFSGHQVVRMDVICDGDGNFIDNIDGDAERSIYDSGCPYGPFVCTRCGAHYDELKDGALVEDMEMLYVPIDGKPGMLAEVASFRIGNDGDAVTVRPFHNELFAKAKPIGNAEITAAIADHRIVRSWLVKAKGFDTQALSPTPLIKESDVVGDTPEINPTTNLENSKPQRRHI